MSGLAHQEHADREDCGGFDHIDEPTRRRPLESRCSRRETVPHTSRWVTCHGVIVNGDCERCGLPARPR